MNLAPSANQAFRAPPAPEVIEPGLRDANGAMSKPGTSARLSWSTAVETMFEAGGPLDSRSAGLARARSMAANSDRRAALGHSAVPYALAI